jgi:penicillin-binding protein 1A
VSSEPPKGSSSQPPAQDSDRGAGREPPAPALEKAAENWPDDPKVGERWKVVAITWFKRVVLSLAVLAAVAALTIVGVVRYYESDLPSVEELKRGYEPPQVTRVLASDGTLLASLFTERRTVVTLAEVSDPAKLAFLAAEDARFYEHEGLNYLGMLRALWVNVRAGRTVQGGSTITQQVVKNLLLDSERTYRRKIRETILARRLEQHLSKDEIYNLYLNHIYLGHGRYGVEEAARYYFGKKAKDLDLAEATLLAGIVASPERMSPRNAPDKALARRRYVLDQMKEKGFATDELHAASIRAPLRLSPAVDAESALSPEVVALVKRTLEAAAGPRAKKGGFVVQTTIDPGLQAAARKAVRDNLDDYQKRQKLAPPFTLEKRRLWGPAFQGRPKAHHIYVGRVRSFDDSAGTIEIEVGEVVGQLQLDKEERFNPKRLKPSEFVAVGAALRVGVSEEPTGTDPVALRLELGPQSALVAIDPRTRHVRALVGSYEALPGGLDRATRAMRQPGSAFKPFVYGYALKSRRLTPASVLELPAAGDGVATTRTIRVREALAKSDNAAAEHILGRVGAPNVVEHARALGIDSKLGADLSMALGSYELRPIEITNAYATLASGGEFAPPILVTKIVGPDGKEVTLPERPPKRRVMDESEAYLTTSLMRSVVTEGTGKRALAVGRPVVGKTGTTNRAKDGWFVGYSTDLVAAVWVGYDDALPLGWGESGGVSALPAWVQFMRGAHKGKPSTDFTRPAGVVVMKIDPQSGLLAPPGQEGAIEEEFLAGTEPSEVAELDAGVDAAPDAGPELADAGVPAEVLDPEAVQASAQDAGRVGSGDAQALVPSVPAEDLPPF